MGQSIAAGGRMGLAGSIAVNERRAVTGISVR